MPTLAETVQGQILPQLTGPSALSGQIQAGLTPFFQGQIGQSSVFDAAVNAFRENTLPVIQNQLNLQGLGSGPAIANVAGRSLGANLVPLIQNDITNRLSALSQGSQLDQINANRLGAGAGVAQAEEQLNQSAAALQADIANRAAQNNLQAQQLNANLLLGFGQQIASPAAQLQLQQAQGALGGLSTAGETQRNVQQQGLDAQNLDFLRRQGLAEQSTTGLFGTVLPPTLQQSGSSTTTGGGK